MINFKRNSIYLLFYSFLISGLFSLPASASESDWPQYAGDEGGSRYSHLDQINRENIKNLEVAWTYKTGHLDRVPEQFSFLKRLVGFQVTPIILPEEAGGFLVFCTPFNEIIALDGATGKKVWSYDPKIDLRPFAGRFNCRGLAQWKNPNKELDELCAHSLFLAANDKRLIAVDAISGNPCSEFGSQGVVDVLPYI